MFDLLEWIQLSFEDISGMTNLQVFELLGWIHSGRALIQCSQYSIGVGYCGGVSGTHDVDMLLERGLHLG